MSINNSSKLFSLFEEKLGDRAQFNAPLAPHVAYQVGGPADILVFPNNEEELNWIDTLAKSNQIPQTVIGTGTNLLVVDEGIRGIVISLAKAFQTIEEIPGNEPGKVWIKCGGGVLKPTLLKWAIEKGYTGLEFSSGVPGTIGGGIYMNAGTKYGCYGDILKELRFFDFNTGFKQLKRQDLHFSYRESEVRNSLVIWAMFELQHGDSATIRKEVDRIILERAEKQPLDFPSCGSTFKNGSDYSSGRLIEKAGLKGLCVGGAEISTKHANFILNKGNATAKDILTLIDIIKVRVREQFGVTLECEVCVLGGQLEGTKSQKN
ncbi:MAG: UDP-N-acetylmuramate dehydrogenase [Deltaproteobacteria bacterium]|nr:UDP-N-acetylmuramate dehydrogenase [Deltaproteobacteria bacterium]